MSKRFLTGFVSGVAVALAGSMMVLPAMAAVLQRQITVTTGVSAFLDDERIEPTDENGRPVEVINWNGTVYLPMRAMAEALELPVEWDQEKQAVYLGEHDVDPNLISLTELVPILCEPISREGIWVNPMELVDSMGVKHKNAFSLNGTVRVKYALDRQYQTLEGLFALQERSMKTSAVSSLKIIGDGRTLYQSGAMEIGSAPMSFTLDVTKVQTLEILYGTDSEIPAFCVLGDVNLHK